MSGAIDATIEALDLVPWTRAAAYRLRKKHPELLFLCGRRSVEDQARLMAKHLSRDHSWLRRSYEDSDLRETCQIWLDEHIKATEAEIEAGLLQIFSDLNDRQLRTLSRHLTGEAFDVQPVEDEDEAERILADIHELPLLRMTLDGDGSKRIWHLEF